MTKMIFCMVVVLVGFVGISLSAGELRPSYQSPSVPYRAPIYHINVTPSIYSPAWSDTKAYHFKDGNMMIIAPNTADDRYGPVHLVEREGYFSRYRRAAQRRIRPVPRPVISSSTYKPATKPIPVQIQD